MKVTRIIKAFVFVMITAFFFQVVGVPTEAYARWDRGNPDDLPGMSDEPSISPLLYVALGLVIVGIIYVIVKNKQAGDGNKEIERPLEEGQGSDGDSSFLLDTTESVYASPY